MNRFKELQRIQDNLIDQFKSKHYHELIVMPKRINHELDQEFKGFSLVTSVSTRVDHLEIIVELKDLNEIIMPDYFNEILTNNNISFSSSSRLDGFKIFHDGMIVNMHLDEFDDD